MSLRKLPEIKAFQHSDLLPSAVPDEAVSDFNAAVRAADEADNVISIYGAIGRDPFSDVDNSERRIGGALRAVGRRDITVNINSPGGNFLSGLAIYNLLRAHPAKVTVNVLAMAGSAASVIAMAGDEILMADGSFIMVHNASALLSVNKFTGKDALEILADVDDAMAEIYAARAGVTKPEAAAWMDKGRGAGSMFRTSAAIEHGLADGKLPSSAVKVIADAAKQIPVERAVERALTAGEPMPASKAKALISEWKSGMRDDAGKVRRDADTAMAADMKQLLESFRALKGA
jgi:ATP-dependent protease ClpP protease subunit